MEVGTNGVFARLSYNLGFFKILNSCGNAPEADDPDYFEQFYCCFDIFRECWSKRCSYAHYRKAYSPHKSVTGSFLLQHWLTKDGTIFSLVKCQIFFISDALRCCSIPSYPLVYLTNVFVFIHTLRRSNMATFLIQCRNPKLYCIML